MTEEKKKSWIRRHWIISIILGIPLLLVVLGIIVSLSGNVSDSSTKNTSPDDLITTNSNLLVPQDSDVDRIWRIKVINSIKTNATGFIEGAEREMSKVESLEVSSIVTKVYRFDSVTNANQFYNQEKQRIDVRGVNEWDLGSDCFGIEKDVVLSGFAEGLCLRNNILFYIRSTSSSYDYASDGKNFMKLMLKKV